MENKGDVSQMDRMRVVLRNMLLNNVGIVGRPHTSPYQATHPGLFCGITSALEGNGRIKNRFLRRYTVKDRSPDVSLAGRVVVQVLHVDRRAGGPGINHADYLGAHLLASGKDLAGDLLGSGYRDTLAITNISATSQAQMSTYDICPGLSHLPRLAAIRHERDREEITLVCHRDSVGLTLEGDSVLLCRLPELAVQKCDRRKVNDAGESALPDLIQERPQGDEWIGSEQTEKDGYIADDRQEFAGSILLDDLIGIPVAEITRIRTAARDPESTGTKRQQEVDARHRHEFSRHSRADDGANHVPIHRDLRP